jgi:hypothetical protein
LGPRPAARSRRRPDPPGTKRGPSIAFYKLSYGVAALGTGPLRDLGLPFSTIFAAGSIVVLPLAVIASFVIGRPPLLGGIRP